MDIDRVELDREVDALRPLLVSIAQHLHNTPELAFEEHRAAAWLGDAIESEGLGVERGFGGLPSKPASSAPPSPRRAVLLRWWSNSARLSLTPRVCISRAPMRSPGMNGASATFSMLSFSGP